MNKRGTIKIFVLSIILLVVILMPFLFSTQLYLNKSSQWQWNLTKIYYSTTILGDIDNDNDLDLVTIGYGSTFSSDVYINNGTSLVENSTWQQNLTSVNYGSLAFGDVDNDGDLDLVLTGCNNGGTYVGGCGSGGVQTLIYINNGTSLVESSQWQSNLTKTFRGGIAFGDVDNDGDLDLVLTGQTETTYISKIYINNGTSLVESSQWQSNLSAMRQSGLAFGDIDNDGELDLILSGRDLSSNKRTIVYINNGSTLTENSTWQQNLETMDDSSVILGDYDNDGDLDLSITGCCDEHRIYRNNGITFIEIQRELVDLDGMFAGSQAFGDYDNDGDLDLIANGRETSNVLHLYNVSSTNFTSYSQDPESHILDVIYGSLVWVDLDNDNDLDLIETGYGSEGGGDGNATVKAFVYTSNRSLTKNNTKPNPPTINFVSSYSDGIFNLSWGNGSDSETNNSGLYYNLMIGNTTQNNTIVSGMFGGYGGGSGGGGGANGYFGNMMQRKNLSLNKYLNNDTYTWYVQTIDTGLQKSNWSAVQSIVIGGDTTAPVISSVSSSVTSSTATVTWTTGETSNSTVLYGTTISLGSRSSSSSLVASHSISLSSLSASTLYYYNISSCDNWNNCNTSIRYNFTTSAAGGDGGGGGGGGGSGGGGSSKIITPTPEPEKKLFDIDFSSVSCGIFEAEQGDIKTFTFNGEIIHEIAISEIISPSARLIFRPESLGLLIKTQEIKQIDLNKDNINDLQIKLFSIINKKASFSLCKLAGADILSQEEIEEAIRKEALFDVKIAIVNLFEIVRSGREVIANIEAINVNHIGQVDVIVDYYITSKKDNMTKLAQGSDTLAVEAVTSFVRSLKVPYNTKSGNYLFNVDITYKDFMTSSNAEFRVIRNYEIIIGIGVIVFIVVVIFFYLWILKRKENKLEGQIKIMKKSMGNKILIIRKKKKGDKKWQK